MADRAVLAKPAGDQQVAQASGDGQSKGGGLSDFASSVWSKTKEVAQAAKPYGEKALDAAKEAAQAAKPMGEKALEGAKDAGQKAQKFGKESGLTEDVTAIGKETINKYAKDGSKVVSDAKKGNYSGAAIGGAKIGLDVAVKAHLGPLEIIADKAPELVDRQAGRHLSREQAQQVHGATELVRKGSQIGKVVSGGPSGLADAALDQAKKSAKQEILNNPEQVQNGASTLADKAKGLFNDLKKRMPSGNTQPAEQSQH